MLSQIWNTFLYEPFLNALAFLVGIAPNENMGLAVIALTILVKLVLWPISQKSIEGQNKMNKLAPEIEKIKKSGLSREEQAKKTFELYREHKTNPFSGCLLVLLQIPVIFALYKVFLNGVSFNEELLYSFIKIPENVNTIFLGFLDISQKSLPLALFAGLTQYVQAMLMPKPKENKDKKNLSFQESLAYSMQIQMKFVFPVLITFISYTISGAMALYWAVSNIFTIFQQIHADKKQKRNIN